MKKKKIDKNIPLFHARNKIYPFLPLESMEVGDSFSCSTDKELNSATALSYRYGKSTGKKFARRKTRWEGKRMPGGRIWRIE